MAFAAITVVDACIVSLPAETPTPETEVTTDDAATTTEAATESSAEVEASVAVTDMTPSVSEGPTSTVDEFVTEASYATDDDSDGVSQTGVTEPATATAATVPAVSSTTPKESEVDSEETLVTTDAPDATQEVSATVSPSVTETSTTQAPVTSTEPPTLSTDSEAPVSSTQSTEDVTDSDVTSASPSPSSSEYPDSDEKEEGVSAATEPVSPSPAATTPSTTLPTTTESPFPPFPGYTDSTTTPTTPAMTYGPGACVFNGKVYASAQQIPRDDPCDFCFCFRGDIICLQQSCPPPIPNCYEEAIPGFCCPRYECPVVQTLVNVTTTTTPIPTYPPVRQQVEVVMCEIGNRYYHKDQLVEEASGPCLECR